MNRTVRRLLVPLLCLALASLGVLGAGPATAGPSPLPASGVPHAACAPVPAGKVRCLAQYRTSTSGRRAYLPQVIQTLGPSQIASAYGLRGGAVGVTVAIVGAFSNPNLEKDLAVYRKVSGLRACTVRNGCLRIVNQRGATSPLPQADPDWGLEAALDVDAVSAACPACKILVVEADDNDTMSLAAGVNTAVRLNAAVVSNSYGGPEYTAVPGIAARYYRHPGVPIVASSGDDGFQPAGFPASSTTVISVGGTSLTRNLRTARGWSESAWDGSGSGCSAWFAKPAYQSRRLTHCPMRTSTDLSAVADPYSNFAVYDTFGTPTDWLLVGGTSLSAPLVAGMIARAGHSKSYGTTAGRIYRHRSWFHDIRSGSNGYCGGDYLCTAKKGYDAPTGVGTPRTLAGL
ncbi:subtilase family protein [Branchiibius hedensis]|uniref:Subtilase family protein n=1 Tax=Branchiibius hedensis TaxID=672460 RepID=A0A2Y8ZSI8_9MICO|nr:S53 family peptidase [Branchiibius hedensis]PWJ26519.1 subtilase family protein [Branchiibius hedensis]SSA35331.1 Subtilase family protein [Branchiibius hedensis]